MVNAEKLKLKRVMKFKNAHVNNVVGKYLRFAKREEGNVVYEDIFIMNKLVGYFKHEGATVTFEEVKCQSNQPISTEEMNSLPQS